MSRNNTDILFGLIQQTLRLSMRAQTKRIKGFGYLQGCVEYNSNPITPEQAERIDQEIDELEKDIDNLTVGAIKIRAAYHRLTNHNTTQNNGNHKYQATAATNGPLQQKQDSE